MSVVLVGYLSVDYGNTIITQHALRVSKYWNLTIYGRRKCRKVWVYWVGNIHFSRLLCILRQPPSSEQKTARRLCCTFGGSVESYKVVYKKKTIDSWEGALYLLWGIQLDQSDYCSGPCGGTPPAELQRSLTHFLLIVVRGLVGSRHWSMVLGKKVFCRMLSSWMDCCRWGCECAGLFSWILRGSVLTRCGWGPGETCRRCWGVLAFSTFLVLASAVVVAWCPRMLIFCSLVLPTLLPALMLLAMKRSQ